MWPVVRVLFEPSLDALAQLGDEVEAARFEGRQTSPRDALARLATDAQRDTYV